MSFEPKELANGQISGSPAAIFTATADATYIKTFTLGCESLPSSTPVVVTLWLKHGSSAARFYRSFELDERQSADVLGGAESIILAPGSAIIAEASISTTVDFWLAGVEETF